MKVANGYEYIAILEGIAPRKYAMEGDPIGLQIGDLSHKVRKIMFTLDVLENVVDEAIVKGVDLIIAHHPLLFRPLKKIDMATPEGRIVKKLIKHDITVYAAHTNLDIANGGVNDALSELLGLEDTDIIVPTYKESYSKMAVYTPDFAEESVRLALVNNGAGKVSDLYSECTFSMDGTGRFLPGEEANPTIGEPGKLEEVQEVRIEAIFPRSEMDRIMKAVKIAHPYEVPVIDVMPIENIKSEMGLGRIGNLPKAMEMHNFIAYVKEKLSMSNVRVIGDLTTPVRKVGIIGGDGNKFIHNVKRAGADVFITGDIYYHTGHDLLAIGLPTIDAGHYIEKVMKASLRNQFEAMARVNGYEVELLVSEENTNPFTFY
ncbi:Nif3-like dinuclear metal center hexameric protein [Listeria booriae]|uniref:Nif3-like dinuclear metal center hexameric protein n=1 Tax=Listeria booriae TaxID=1552123 RepID=UPI001628507F|nr:Nif3-like dinuclear metal center hexameric protein [Listeria booriae]MBC1293100.1 Nif3-like dinuclear metal center hexameric protein [Listeria booriae]MBC1918802.1 Nif3-like dinuclear metal center hexameric protein [Listeria booriae]MBC1946014.1 Nif3-like dinuclear metal center hexameric protein [Listeria booriae]MBC2104292.1 Nif3-like dinuclear metal center hexameric protein [Listeria booriae]MBC2318742.1 Nif3-like dinuclear metal center hexameric protein [Listeria booriae]